MIQVKFFKLDDEKGVNKFLAENAIQSVFFTDDKVSVTYEDTTPITSVQKKSLIRDQIAKATNVLLEAQVNSRLTGDALKEKRDPAPSKEQLQELMNRDRLAKAQVKDNQKIVDALQQMHDELK